MEQMRRTKGSTGGVPWLESLPPEWTAVPLGWLGRSVGGGTPAKDQPAFWGGQIPWVSPKDMKVESIDDTEDKITEAALKTSATSLLPAGRVLLVTRSGILKHTLPVAINRVPCALNQDMRGFDTEPRLKPQFLLRYLQGLNTTVLAALVKQGATVESVDGDLLRRLPVPMPPRAQQEAICNFLDRETTRIDALIEKKSRFIELLREKRQALITQAVTKGLDPSVPMKDSGVAWLGQVPAHWQVTRLMFVVDAVEQGWSPECDGSPAIPGEWGVLKAGCVNRGVYNAGENKSLPQGLEPRPELEVKEGDVLMSRASGSFDLIGSVAFVDKTPTRLMLSDKLFRLRVSAHVDKRFLVALLGSTVLREQIKQSISGAEGLANNLPQSSLKNLALTCPPLDEQRTIAAAIFDQVNRLDALIDRSRGQLNSLASAALHSSPQRSLARSTSAKPPESGHRIESGRTNKR